MPELAVAPDPINTDPPSFDALYRENAADVFAYVMTLLRDRAAAEDVTMAAFERAFRKRRTFDRRRGNERAWLFGIARNAALDELRRLKRVAPLTGDIADEGGGEEQDPLRRAAVRSALAGLDARDRELVMLKFVAGMSNAEMAEVIGTSPTNAGTRLHRVVAKLREACHAPS
ncbi:MAG: RNA polymerase sigma factor [Solirubrobacteraceae bacterium]